MADFSALLPLGWLPRFEAEVQELKANEVAARVMQVERGFCKIAVSLDHIVLSEISGKLRFDAKGNEDLPVVGDFVIAKLSPDGGRAIISQILGRKSCLKRQSGRDVQLFAANIDYVMIMTSANDDFNPRRLERYLAMTWDSGAEPVLLLSKVDLCQDTQEYVTVLNKLSFNSPVVLISSLEGKGLQELDTFLSATKTSIVVGSSGVGKSTLINKLLGQEMLLTQEIRLDDDKGRHTTTSRSLYLLPSGGLLIDTPGIRELQLAPTQGGLSHSFQEVEAITAQCKFADCTHREEPGCAVTAALEKGELDEERWLSYMKLLKEQRSLEVRKDPLKMKEEKAKWKQINKDLRARYKLKGKKGG